MKETLFWTIDSFVTVPLFSDDDDF